MKRSPATPSLSGRVHEWFWAACAGVACAALCLPPRAGAFDVYGPRTLIGNAVSYYYPVPAAIDWDSDGDWDLLIGEWGQDGLGYFGGVRLYVNQGTNAAPDLVFNSYVSAGGSQIRLGYG